MKQLFAIYHEQKSLQQTQVNVPSVTLVCVASLTQRIAIQFSLDSMLALETV